MFHFHFHLYYYIWAGWTAPAIKQRSTIRLRKLNKTPRVHIVCLNIFVSVFIEQQIYRSWPACCSSFSWSRTPRPLIISSWQRHVNKNHRRLYRASCSDCPDCQRRRSVRFPSCKTRFTGRRRSLWNWHLSLQRALMIYEYYHWNVCNNTVSTKRLEFFDCLIP